ncbi:PAAR domain-containing protein [Dyella terrae]|uniref:PAAR domain-containing protein n=1 Tax=Dyella terrae TaxID=522259 RepID=UPI001EFE38D8|nr:PAAR domain-containing protein [Dyella terrae]ULU23592.1 PAAR domain-containing protein [Dyella terrae]
MLFPGKRPVREGDTTTHGGTVLNASHLWRIGGRRVVQVGDAVMCPSCGHTTIVEGDPLLRMAGVSVALHGHRTSCGALLLASLQG